MVEKINLTEALAQFSDLWSPRIVAELNGFEAKLVKIDGEFVWHSHDEEDELFLVLAGRLRMQLRDGDQELGPGELIVVPAGVEHCPVGEGETHVLLFERAGTVNTGNAGGERTKEAVRL